MLSECKLLKDYEYPASLAEQRTSK